MVRDIQVDIALQGYSFIPKLKPEMDSYTALTELGVIECVDGFEPIQVLTPKAQENAPLNTYSGNFGTQSFPLHSDLAHWAIPPRYVALRCIEGTAAVSTLIQDGRDIIQKIGEDRMAMSLSKPRRQFHSHANSLLRLLERTEEGYRLRWDSIYLKPANRLAIPVFEEVYEALKSIQPTEVCLAEGGDTLIIDNWRMLHGRSSVPNGIQRRIARAYMERLAK